jgi:WD40 repeat protein
MVLTACSDGHVRLFKKNGELTTQYRQGVRGAVASAAWMPDDASFVCGDASGQLHVVNSDGSRRKLVQSAPSFTKGHAGAIKRVRVTPDGSTIVSAGDDKSIKIWTSDGHLKRTIVAHSGPVLGLDINRNGTLVASAGRDGLVRVFRIATGEEIMHVQAHDGAAYCVAFTPEAHGRRLISGGHDRTMVVMETGSGVIMQRMVNLHKSWILGVAVRFDGLQFASASGDRTVGMWDALPVTKAEEVGGCLQALLAGIGRFLRAMSGKEDSSVRVMAASQPHM